MDNFVLLWANDDMMRSGIKTEQEITPFTSSWTWATRRFHNDSHAACPIWSIMKEIRNLRFVYYKYRIIPQPTDSSSLLQLLSYFRISLPSSFFEWSLIFINNPSRFAILGQFEGTASWESFVSNKLSCLFPHISFCVYFHTQWLMYW